MTVVYRVEVEGDLWRVFKDGCPWMGQSLFLPMDDEHADRTLLAIRMPRAVAVFLLLLDCGHDTEEAIDGAEPIADALQKQTAGLTSPTLYVPDTKLHEMVQWLRVRGVQP